MHITSHNWYVRSHHFYFSLKWYITFKEMFDFFIYNPMNIFMKYLKLLICGKYSVIVAARNHLLLIFHFFAFIKHIICNILGGVMRWYYITSHKINDNHTILNAKPNCNLCIIKWYVLCGTNREWEVKYKIY